ncbi:MAG: DUF6498-containing protein [Dehalococcoidia bacterium]|nr:DUF6498-containing protein [Dehalococcoidia bacterium]
MNPSKYFRADSSAAILVLSNLVTIAFALALKWDIRDVMWIYWGQSIIIGLFAFLRILDLKQFSTEGFRINNQPARPTRQTRWQVAGFFALHYGFFHFVYLIFLLALATPDSSTPFLGIGLCLLAFLLSHAFSFWHNRQRDRDKKPNIGCVMFFPYGRIIPMHFAIILGGWLGPKSTGALLLFLVLKTLADVLMHMAEHADRDAASLPPSDTPRAV